MRESNRSRRVRHQIMRTEGPPRQLTAVCVREHLREYVRTAPDLYGPPKIKDCRALYVLGLFSACGPAPTTIQRSWTQPFSVQGLVCLEHSPPPQLSMVASFSPPASRDPPTFESLRSAARNLSRRTPHDALLTIDMPTTKFQIIHVRRHKGSGRVRWSPRKDEWCSNPFRTILCRYPKTTLVQI
jgi:hypothetical protein